MAEAARKNDEVLDNVRAEDIRRRMAALSTAEQEEAGAELAREKMRLQAANDAMAADFNAMNQPLDSERESEEVAPAGKTETKAKVNPGNAIDPGNQNLEAANEPMAQTDDSGIENMPSSIIPDEWSTTPGSLSPEEQRKAAVKTEKARQKKEEKRLYKNERNAKANELLGPANLAKSLWNRREIKALENEILELDKKMKELNEKGKAQDKIVREKKREEESEMAKAVMQIFRMSLEILSAVGIIGLFYEFVLVAKRNEKVRKARLQWRLAQREMKKIQKEERDIRQKIKNIKIKIYNLSNVLKLEAKPS